MAEEIKSSAARAWCALAPGIFSALKALQPLIRKSIEGGIAIGTFWLSVEMYWWAAHFIEKADPEHLAQAAAAVGAVLTPLSLLQGYVLAKYIQSVQADKP